MRWSVVSGLMLGVALSPFVAIASEGLGHFRTHRDEGWFFYKDPKDTTKKEAPLKQERSQSEKKPEPHIPKVTEPAYSGPPPMSAAWLKIMLPKYLEKALDDPTPTNVQAYLILQKLSLDKASRFAQMAQRVTLTDPMLDEVTRRPLATAGTRIATAMAQQRTKQLLSRMSKHLGFFVFYTRNCSYCSLLGSVLKAYKRLYGFTTLPISLDGSPLPEGFPLDAGYRLDQGQSETMRVKASPAVFLVNPATGEYESVVQGAAISMDEMQQRVLAAAVQKGWISESEYRQALPQNDIPYLQASSMSEVDKDGFIDPHRIVQAFEFPGGGGE